MELSVQLKNLLSNKNSKVAILSGAGISKESGVPTFRDADGFWAKCNPQELASMDGFLANPELVWSWYQHRREILNKVKPNPGHYTLVEMEEYFSDFSVITQNVDDLHAVAGSKSLIELHGNITENFCIECGEKDESLNDKTQLIEKNPRCVKCNGRLRPGVVWFGEMLPERNLAEAFRLSENADLFFSIGTQGSVYPAASLPQIAKNAGAYTVEINPSETDISHQFDELLRLPSAEALPLLWQERN